MTIRTYSDYLADMKAVANPFPIEEWEWNMHNPILADLDAKDIAVFNLTVITANGEYTAKNIREDSIVHENGEMRFEDTSHYGVPYTFYNVIGWYSSSE